MTTWIPDTCGCAITLTLPSPDFDWANITADHVKSVKPCTQHVGHPLEVFTQVYHRENKIKNRLLSHVQANLASLRTSTESSPTSCPHCAAYGVPGRLIFDANRIPSYLGSGLDTASIQAWADSTFGAGVVIAG